VCADITATRGISLDPKDEGSRVPSLTEEESEELIERGIIDGGMMPKVRASAAALAKGVSRAHIIDGRLPHSLLLEIFTDEGVGTMIVRQQ